MVSANYRLYGLHDPTCEESANFGTAGAGASADIVGWASNAVLIEVVSDLVRIGVLVEVGDEAPAVDAAADLVRDGRLEVPGGVVSIPQSVDDVFQRGVELPAGPGTYGVHVSGYGRSRARQLWQAGDFDALTGVESYRISLWRVSSEPRWVEDDEDD
jgi:hypothetical protein